MPPPSFLTVFDQLRIHSHLSTKTFGHTLCVLPEVASTNTHALTLADSQTAHGLVVVADRQTAGRGRLNRTWFSPPESNLYTSVLLAPAQGFRALSWIPLIAGLALREAIHKACDLPTTLKWPNDLLFQDKKVGGILCEGHTQGSHHQLVVVGFGLNVNMSDTDFPEPLRDHSTSLLMQTGSVIDRNILLAAILNALETWYEKLIEGPIRHVHSAYTAQCGTLGRQLRVHLTNGEKFEAIGRAIGEDGSLHVCLNQSSTDPLRILHSGDVTHLKIMSA